MNLNTPIWQLTVGEFLDLQKQIISPPPVIETRNNKQLIYGISGIAKLFGCSTTTAQRIKNSGVIDKAISQIGRKIIIDANLAIELMSQSKSKRN